MEFSYNDHTVRIILNPSDINVRFENVTDYRIYERTFTDRDFPSFTVLGGITSLGKMLVGALDDSMSDVELDAYKAPGKEISFDLVYSPEFMDTPLTFTFQLPAVKKEASVQQNDDIMRNIKLLSESITAIKKTVEERCGDSIVLPGCPFVINAHAQTLRLGQFNTADPVYGSTYAPANCLEQLWNNGCYPYKGTLSTITPLRYLKDCRTLTINFTTTVGVSTKKEVSDYAPLGEITTLTSLSIYNSKSLESITWIISLKELTEVSFHGCTNLINVSYLSYLKKLKKVTLTGTSVKNTSFLGSGVQVVM
jgi:hypothetical protein